jgi:hypothetical protein
MANANSNPTPDVLAGLEEDERFNPDERPISPKIQGFVDRAYTYWQSHKDEWRAVTLPSKSVVEEVLTDARHYGNHMRAVPVTVQVRSIDNVEGGTRLVYRVRDKVRSGRKPTK